MEEALFPASVAGKLLGISFPLLLFLEERGLATPYRHNNYRYYRNSDIERLKCLSDKINNKKLPCFK